MSSQYDQDRAALQAKLDALRDGVTLKLPPKEYPGPIEIKHPLTLDGQGATVWARHGAVINVSSDGVVLRNLKIEVTGGDATTRMEDECALSVQPNRTVKLENVEVRGSVIGLRDEEGDWLYPSSLQLGSLDFGVEHDLLLRIYVPVECRFSSSVSGLMIQPTKLSAGPNEVRLHVERLPQDTLLNGSFLLTTARLVRRIMVNARISSAPPPAPKRQARSRKVPKEEPKTSRVVWQPEDWDSIVSGKKPQPSGDSSAPQPEAGEPPPIIFVTDERDPQPKPISDQVGNKVPSVQPPPSVPPPVVETVEQYHPVSSKPAPEPPPVGEGEELYDPNAPPLQTLPSQTPAPHTPVPLVSPHVSAPPVTSPPVVPRPGPRSRRNLFIGLGAALVLALAVAVWLLFMGGPKAINYGSVSYLQALPADDEVYAVAFSPDGETLAGAAKNGKVKLWDPASGKLKLELPKAGGSAPSEITCIAFSSDGTKLVGGTGAADTNVILWDAQTGAQLKVFRGHQGRINSVAFASDGTNIVSGSEDGTVKIWDSQSLSDSSKKTDKLDGPVKAVAASSDGTVAAASDKGTIKRWDGPGGKQKSDIIRNGAVLALAFSPDGKLLAGATAEATVVLWKTEDGTQDKTLRGDHKAQVNAVAFSPDGLTVVSGGADTFVYLWDAVAGGKAQKALTQNTGPVYSVAVSSHGKVIASGGADKTVKLWGNK